MFLTLQQIKKSFGQGESKVEVLKGIDLAVEQGEFLCPPWTVGIRKINVVKYHRRYRQGG